MFVLYLVIVPCVLCTLPSPVYHLHVHDHVRWSHRILYLQVCYADIAVDTLGYPEGNLLRLCPLYLYHLPDPLRIFGDLFAYSELKLAMCTLQLTHRNLTLCLDWICCSEPTCLHTLCIHDLYSCASLVVIDGLLCVIGSHLACNSAMRRLHFTHVLISRSLPMTSYS